MPQKEKKRKNMREGLAHSHVLLWFKTAMNQTQRENHTAKAQRLQGIFSVGLESKAAGRGFAAPANRDHTGDEFQRTVCSLRMSRSGERGDGEATAPILLLISFPIKPSKRSHQVFNWTAP